ncbi:MAG: PEP-CTERM sorting domain-containing protein [Pirellulales bacterium]
MMLLVLLAGTPAQAASELVLWQDADGTVYLSNTTNAPLSFTGYGIVSPDGDLDPAAWRSIADWTASDPSAVIDTLGGKAPGFVELVASGSLVSEANPIGAATLQPPFGKVSIGRPFKDILGFYNFANTAYYTVPGSSDHLIMDYARLPEPSTWLLAALAALGGAAFRKRRRRNPS